MVKVASSSGGFVQVEITGVGEVMKRLRLAGWEVENNVDLEVVRCAAFIEDEVKESIIGNRSESKSVDTGLLGNSIEANKKGWAHMVVEPNDRTYPNGVKVKDVATFLEYGTSRGISPRRHFRNTEARNKKEVLARIENAVKKAAK